MKIAVIGGTGLIGSRLVTILSARGHEAVPHSTSTGVDLLSGRGLSAALAGADVVVTDDSAGMYAAASGSALVAKDGAGIARTTYREWLAR
ncbi:hypothetical protein [Microbispora catharanthi]|uniref:NAD-dependent epimerase/dehydratase family protein n=1 Tax=Microbispora catharanthi TaxID=1712871 RepID=A0A5N6BQU4_9ACTN|nr:hypothetical protein [Microbispora catharanthi]KAB8182812.1 hypothetical protein FH610_022760 [Microbispora catharanthi]